MSEQVLGPHLCCIIVCAAVVALLRMLDVANFNSLPRFINLNTFGDYCRELWIVSNGLLSLWKSLTRKLNLSNKLVNILQPMLALSLYYNGKYSLYYTVLVSIIQWQTDYWLITFCLK